MQDALSGLYQEENKTFIGKENQSRTNRSVAKPKYYENHKTENNNLVKTYGSI